MPLNRHRHTHAKLVGSPVRGLEQEQSDVLPVRNGNKMRCYECHSLLSQALQDLGVNSVSSRWSSFGPTTATWRGRASYLHTVTCTSSRWASNPCGRYVSLLPLSERQRGGQKMDIPLLVRMGISPPPSCLVYRMMPTRMVGNG